MCEPRKLSTDIVETWVFGTLDVVKDLARWWVRAAAKPFSDERVERARWMLTWRFAIELLLAAALVWYMGRSAMYVFAGGAVGSWLLGYGLRRELARRAAEPQPEPQPEPVPSERPDLRAVS